MKKCFLLCILSVYIFVISGCSITETKDMFSYEKHISSYESLSVFADDTILPIQLGINEETDESEIAHYSPIAKSDINTLYVDMEKGWFALKDNKKGKIWYSNPNDFLLSNNTTKGLKRSELHSDIVISYYDKSQEFNIKDIKTMSSHLGCVQNKTVKVEKIKSGVKVTYNFSELGIIIPIEYTLDENSFKANILFDEIKEGSLRGDNNKKNDANFLISINLLPSFVSSNPNVKGYTFVPDGSGAIFDNTPIVSNSNIYESAVYGEDLATPKLIKSGPKTTIALPVFGTVNNSDNTALMGVIEKGDGLASITAIRSNNYVYYNSVSSKANYRILGKTNIYENDYANFAEIVKSSLSNENIKEYIVNYYTLSGENVSYIDMSKKYREILTKQNLLKPIETKPSLALNMYRACEDFRALYKEQ